MGSIDPVSSCQMWWFYSLLLWSFQLLCLMALLAVFPSLSCFDSLYHSASFAFAFFSLISLCLNTQEVYYRSSICYVAFDILCLEFSICTEPVLAEALCSLFPFDISCRLCGVKVLFSVSLMCIERTKKVGSIIMRWFLYFSQRELKTTRLLLLTAAHQYIDRFLSHPRVVRFIQQQASTTVRLTRLQLSTRWHSDKN